MAEPIKIGWLGAALDGPDGGYDKIHRLAFDEGVESGLLDRPYEFVLHGENGLPNGTAKNATDGFKYLVDEGCIGIAGAYSSDNAITVAPLANELQVPLLWWAGTDRLQGDYCFRLGNGDCGGDAALVVSWLVKHAHTRIAVLSEIAPNGEEYFRWSPFPAARENEHSGPRTPSFAPRGPRNGVTGSASSPTTQAILDLAGELSRPGPTSL